MCKKLKAAIIGTGVMGKKYAVMLNSGQVRNMELAVVCARSEESRKWAEESLENVKIFRTAEEVFENSHLYDSVIIATPHRLHPQLAKRAFELKKHVMCDKPSGVTTADAREMLEDARKSGMKYGVMFHNRVFPRIKKLKEILESGALGDIKRVILENTIYYRTAFYHRSGGWRSSWKGEGGGALINQGQHIIDYWQWIFGLPETIYADIKFGKYNDFNVDDEAVILMNYKNNMSGTFILSTGEVPREERLKIVGTRGCALMRGNTIELEQYTDSSIYGKTAMTNSREGIETKTETIHCEDAKAPYVEMLENFGDAVLLDTPLIADGKDGLNTLEITCGAYLSAWTGQRVALPVDDKLYVKMLEEKAEI